MAKYAIHVWEDFYGGMHGIYATEVVERENFSEVEDYAYELGQQVIEDYCYDDDDGMEHNIEYSIYLLQKDKGKNVNSLSTEFYYDKDNFLKEYDCKEIFE